MDGVFRDQRGRNVEVYVDDAIIKPKTEADLVPDRRETFETLRKHNLILNPKKYVSKVKLGKFLGLW